MLLPIVLAVSAAVAGPDWQGHYTDGKKGAADIVVVADTAWIVGGRAPIASPFVAGKTGVTLPAASATLHRAGGQWRLETEGRTRHKRVDPFLGQMRAQLAGEKTFTLLDADGKPMKATLTLRDGLAAAVEIPDNSGTVRCSPGLLVHDPTRNGEIAKPAPAEAPKPGTIGRRLFLLVKRHIDDCRAPLAASDETRGLLAGAHLLASSDGRVLGIQLIGYMFSALYVADGLSPGDLQRLRQANQEEVMHQAE